MLYYLKTTGKFLNTFLLAYRMPHHTMDFYKMFSHFTMLTYGVNQAFVDLLKAFGDIESVSKSDVLLSEKTYFTAYLRNMF